MKNKIDLQNVRDLFGKFRLSALEWVSLAATLIFAGVVTFYYLNSTQPFRSKLSELRTKEKSLLMQLSSEAEKRKNLEDQRANADKILDSLDSFEARLHNRKVGITAIIDEVNQIAKANRVKAGDISFRTDTPEPLPGEGQPGASPTATRPPITKRDKLPVVYEGLGIDTTVEGDYADLRRFIAALEKSRNFIIINTITLQSIDEKQRSKFKVGNPVGAGGPELTAGQPVAAGMDAEGPNKIVVSLKIEMQTHFSRADKSEPNLLPASAPAQ